MSLSVPPPLFLHLWVWKISIAIISLTTFIKLTIIFYAKYLLIDPFYYVYLTVTIQCSVNLPSNLKFTRITRLWWTRIHGVDISKNSCFSVPAIVCAEACYFDLECGDILISWKRCCVLVAKDTTSLVAQTRETGLALPSQYYEKEMTHFWSKIVKEFRVVSRRGWDFSISILPVTGKPKPMSREFWRISIIH